MSTRHIITTALAAFLLCFTSSAVAADGDVVDPGPFDSILKTYVDGSGNVDYAGIKESETARKKLDLYVESLADADPQGHSTDARLAFWLNAYNALVIDAVVERWPVSSPMKVDGFFDGITHEVAGRSMTLDAIEHKYIRPTFEEPRIHFVLVCAAESCPRLRQQALTAANVESSMEAAAREFIPKATELKDEKTVVTSKLFEWFGEDFEKAAGSVKAYLAKYTDGEVAEALKKSETKVRFSDYSWKINAQ
jgi:hypothetical protein